jgi:hypothetical protein
MTVTFSIPIPTGEKTAIELSVSFYLLRATSCEAKILESGLNGLLNQQMKNHHCTIFLVFFALVLSCKKDQANAKTNPSRKVRYELFTKADFSGDQKNILFSIFMRNGLKTIFDSPLATMKIKDIPDSNHKIVIEKLVPYNDISTLAIGFNYQIENVGNSWYLDTLSSVDTFKVLSYSFR